MMFRVFTATALGLTLLAAPAAAQDTQTRARQLFEQGVASMDSGNPGAATQYFQQSYQLFPRASTACNMALSLERTGRGCDAMQWYRQCAALDTQGSFRDHANRQAAALSQQCPQTQGTNPFVSGPQPGGPPGTGAQVVESGQPNPFLRRRDYDHTMLGIGIPALELGIGAFIGGGFSADEATYQATQIGVEPSGDPENPVVLAEGSQAADAYYSARTFSDLAIGLWVAGGVLSLVGALLITIDLARPGVFGGGAAGPRRGPQLAFGTRPGGGGVGQLTVPF